MSTAIEGCALAADDDGRALVELEELPLEHRRQVARALARIVVAKALRRLDGTPQND